MKRLTLIEKAFLLKLVRPFRDLDLDILLAIADKLISTEYDSDEEVFIDGEEATRMYLIATGSVELLDQNKRPVVLLGEAGFFGEEALFHEPRRHYYAYSRGPSHLLALSRTHLHSIISECPTVALGFLQVFAEALPFRYLGYRREGS